MPCGQTIWYVCLFCDKGLQRGIPFPIPLISPQEKASEEGPQSTPTLSSVLAASFSFTYRWCQVISVGVCYSVWMDIPQMCDCNWLSVWFDSWLYVLTCFGLSITTQRIHKHDCITFAHGMILYPWFSFYLWFISYLSPFPHHYTARLSLYAPCSPYPKWMIAFDCIAFCIYMHRYPIRSLRFVFVILHRHLEFTCTVIPYGCYVSSSLSYTNIAFCVHRYPMRMLHLLCYPTQTIPFVYAIILCGCYVLLSLTYGTQCILHDNVVHDLI